MLGHTTLAALLVVLTNCCMVFVVQADNQFSKKQTVAVENAPIDDVTFRYIKTNGITMRIAEMGDTGPLILMAHGWPESWYSWRHQIRFLAAAGYRVVAPDMRGYGKTDAPLDVNSYDITTLAGDMIGVLDALGEEQATMVGHDWGAIVAAYSTLLYPERFSSLIIMSVPHQGRGASPPIPALKARFRNDFFYMLYHNEAGGIAEAEYDRDPRALLSRLYLSPDSLRQEPTVTNPLRSAGGWIPRLGAAVNLPDWLQQRDLDYLVAQYQASGFRGGLNYYRNLDRNWEITATLVDAKIEVPTLFIAGEKDGVIAGATKDMLRASMKTAIPNLHDIILVPGVGHWIQQEAPDETNQAMIKFLEAL